MKRRVRTLHPGYLVGTKGHSVLKKKTYVAGRRPSLDVEDIVIQKMPISRKTVVEYSYPQTGYNHQASAYSSAVVDDCYDLHNHSRGRDHHLLRKMNNALLSTQPLRSPKAIVAARRAIRNTPTATPHLPVYKEVDLTSPAYYVSPLHRYVRGYKKRFVMAPKYNPYVVLSNWRDNYFDDEDLYFPPSKLRYYPTGVDRYSAWHPLHYNYLRHHLPEWRHYATKRRVYDYTPRRHYRRYYPTHHMALKALLVGDDKLAEPGHPRRARRRYYPERPILTLQENLASLGVPDTTGLRASRPPAPSPVSTHSWKAIREVEGYTKPHSLPWEHRLDSHVVPELHIPKTTIPYSNVRDQVRDVQDKMDRHRQLLDRYSHDGLDSHSSPIGYSGGHSQNEDVAGGDILGKVSPLRRKIRKVICKSRRDPSYFDD